MEGNQQFSIESLMRPPVVTKESTTLRDVLTTMIQERRNSLTVVDAEGAFVGAVSALDIIKEVIPDYIEDDKISAQYADEALFRDDALRVADKQVAEFMVRDIPTITTKDSLIEAAVIAIQHGRGRITVVDSENKPVGVLTRTELKRVIGSYLGIQESNSA